MSESRYGPLITTYGKEHMDKVLSSRILVVGAGGIGCEILKNLVLAGFLTIEVIDLDTIDVSNLNRQFLFRPEHVGKPKASVAAKAAMAFNPEAKIVAHYGNIKDSKFGISYIKTFQVVLNALDNVDARRQVNRICLAAEVPLIDSGTTGYLGQVTPIYKGVTSCYECEPKPAPTVYPICTIRSTPTMPVHCIEWAKECFKLLFGNTVESMLYEDSTTTGESFYMALVTSFIELCTSQSGNVATVIDIGKNILKALFKLEIEKKIELGTYKNAKCIPVPVEVDVFERAAAIATELSSSSNTRVRPSQSSGWDRNVWTDEECAVEFLLAMVEVFTSCRGGDPLIGKLAFDKDDIMAMRFVCAAANIRSNIFSITPQSFYDCKGIAGKIIPAIATTNAIVAGVQVIQAFMILKGGERQTQSTKHTHVLRLPTRRGHFLEPSACDKPNPKCYICNTVDLTLHIDVTKSTLGDFIKNVCKGKLGFNQPTILKGSSSYYEEGDGAEEDYVQNIPRLLSDLGIVDGDLIKVDDFSQDLEVNIIIKQTTAEQFEALGEAASAGFVIGGSEEFERLAADARRKAENESNSNSSSSSSSSSSSVDMVGGSSSSSPIPISTEGKRKRDEDEDSNATKRATLDIDDGDDVITIID